MPKFTNLYANAPISKRETIIARLTIAPIVYVTLTADHATDAIKHEEALRALYEYL